MHDGKGQGAEQDTWRNSGKAAITANQTESNVVQRVPSGQFHLPVWNCGLCSKFKMREPTRLSFSLKGWTFVTMQIIHFDTWESFV